VCTSNLQRKLEQLTIRKTEAETTGSVSQTSGVGGGSNVLTNVAQGVKDMGTNIKDTFHEYTGFVMRD
jgi:hypothetical protein